jgi:hypothetical protein
MTTTRGVWLSVTLGLLWAGSTAAAMSHSERPLFDRLSLAVEGSWATLDTSIRLDSPTLGIGTELDFEQDGGLESSEVFPSASIEYHPGRRHLLRGWWQKFDRENTKQILEDIEFGDVVFPINERVLFSFDEEEFGLGYAYFPLHKKRFALGFGGGIRTLRVGTALEAQDIAAEEEGEFTGPLPFFGLQARWAFADKWRLVSDLGVFYLEIDDYSGGQIAADGFIEHLTFRNVAFGGGIRVGWVDLDVERPHFLGDATIGTASARLYIRIRL